MTLINNLVVNNKPHFLVRVLPIQVEVLLEVLLDKMSTSRLNNKQDRVLCKVVGFSVHN